MKERKRMGNRRRRRKIINRRRVRWRIRKR